MVSECESTTINGIDLAPLGPGIIIRRALQYSLVRYGINGIPVNLDLKFAAALLRVVWVFGAIIKTLILLQHSCPGLTLLVAISWAPLFKVSSDHGVPTKKLRRPAFGSPSRSLLLLSQKLSTSRQIIAITSVPLRPVKGGFFL